MTIETPPDPNVPRQPLAAYIAGIVVWLSGLAAWIYMRTTPADAADSNIVLWATGLLSVGLLLGVGSLRIVSELVGVRSRLTVLDSKVDTVKHQTNGVLQESVRAAVAEELAARDARLVSSGNAAVVLIDPAKAGPSQGH